MTQEVPHWLKKAAAKRSTIEARITADIQQKDTERMVADHSKQQKLKELETSTTDCLEIWARLEIDNTLEAIRSFLGGDSLSLTIVEYEFSPTDGIEVVLPHTKTDSYALKEYGEEKSHHETLISAMNAGIEDFNVKRAHFKEIKRSVQKTESGSTSDPGWGHSESFTFQRNIFSIHLNPSGIIIDSSKHLPIDNIKEPEHVKALVDNYLAGKEPPYRLPPEPAIPVSNR